MYHYVIQFVSDLQQVDGFFRVLRFPAPIKTDRNDITEILLMVALNTTTLTLNSVNITIPTMALKEQSFDLIDMQYVIKYMLSLAEKAQKPQS